MWEHGRHERCFKRKQVWKRRKKCQGWGVFERSLFICKAFSPKWGPGSGRRGGKEAGAGPGLYLLQLGWITKLLPWTNHSKRLTSSMTEPVIPCEEIGNWFLWRRERDHTENGELEFIPAAFWRKQWTLFICTLLSLLFFLYKMTTKSTKGLVIRWLPGQAKGVSVQDTQCGVYPRWPTADGLWAEGGWGPVSLSKSVS